MINLRWTFVIVLLAVMAANVWAVHVAIDSMAQDRAHMAANQAANAIRGADPADPESIRDQLEGVAAPSDAYIRVRSVDGGTIAAPGHDEKPDAVRQTATGTAIVEPEEMGGEATPDDSSVIVEVELADRMIVTQIVALTWMMPVLAILAFLAFAMTERTHRTMVEEATGALDLLRMGKEAESDSKDRAPWWQILKGPSKSYDSSMRELLEKTMDSYRYNKSVQEKEREIRSQRKVLEEQKVEHTYRVHDLKSRIGIVHGMANHALQYLLPGQQRGKSGDPRINKTLRQIREAARQIRGMVEEDLRNDLSAESPVEWVEEVVRTHQIAARSRGIVLRLRVDAEVPGRMPGINEHAIRSGVQNLLVNAVRHSPDEGRIDIEFARDPEDPRYWAIDVMDEGPGVPEGMEERIFEQGYTTASPAETGHGVGLSGALSRMREVSGDLQVVRNRRPKGGAWFRMRWPIQKTGETRIDQEVQQDVGIVCAEGDYAEKARRMVAHVERLDGVRGQVRPQVEADPSIALWIADAQLATEASGRETDVLWIKSELDGIGDTELVRWPLLQEIRNGMSGVLRDEGYEPGDGDIVDDQPVLLLVDDTRENLSMLRDLVQRHLRAEDGIRIWTAGSAEQAQQRIEESGGEINAAIIDYQMPGESGVDLIRWIMRESGHDIACALITAHSGMDIWHEAVVAGARKTFPRPPAPEELRKFLVENLGLKREDPQDEAGRYLLDPQPADSEEARRQVEIRKRIVERLSEAITAIDARDEAGMDRALHTVGGMIDMHTGEGSEMIEEAEKLVREEDYEQASIRVQRVKETYER
ncbi:hybrid sensor histidine kinase/response regulator [Thioalkalivibrio sp. ALE23]|uniref:hybrid sensor histidine kinase/response regulator n=1 Tax=Thioalkalivibrio sp. ALE23 TaxID=1265495 RepID=UPI000375BE24|nr:hybrid sensor histidine kinase/response regulator [Thioalkalivibrio sp. ALE23]